jgi:two-component system sensor histidine kinase TctE
VPARPQTLTGLLLWYLLVPLGVLWLFNVAMTFYIARYFANAAFDRSLYDATRTLAMQIRIETDQPRISLPAIAWNRLPYDDHDRLFFQIRWRDGATIAGVDDLPLPPARPHPVNKPIFYDGVYHGQPVRIAALYLPVGSPEISREVLIQTAETLQKHHLLEREIASIVMTPQFVLILLAAVSVWLGVGRGLAPLARIRQTLGSRSPHDLSPLADSGAPQEIRPLLQSLNALLARLNSTLEAQRRFVADAAHQLRTPLAGLITQSEYALRTDDPADQRHALVQIKASAERASRLVHQLLTLARCEASTARGVAFTTLDLDRLLRAQTAEWAPAAMRHDIDIGYESQAPGATVSGNAVLLRELFANLLDNAIRHAPCGGRVTVRLCEAERPLILVEDDGPGIPPPERERVFERFYRLPGGAGDGSGLGLAIVREIARAHGARAWITEGSGGKGTRVCVQFDRSA